MASSDELALQKYGMLVRAALVVSVQKRCVGCACHALLGILFDRMPTCFVNQFKKFANLLKW